MIVQPGQCYARVAYPWDANTLLDLSGDVLADVTINHGRGQFESGRAAMSSATFTFREYRDRPAYIRLSGVGGTVVIDTGPARDRRRFTGTISDVAWDWQEDDQGRYLAHRATCVGAMARMGSTLGPWAAFGQETARARATGILTQTGMPYRVQQGDYNPQLLLAERDMTRGLLAELEDLTWPAEAILWDDTNGAAVWQEMGHRRTTPIIDLPCDAVLWAPGYGSANDLVNGTYLEWGVAPDGGVRPVVQANDADAQFWLGQWVERWSTPYADQSSAQLKADRIVRRQARPAVLMPSVTVLLNKLSPAVWAAVMALRVGDRVRLPQLPEPMPWGGPTSIGAVMVVEGWTEHAGSRWNPDRDWTLDLHLSPPIWSMVSRRWDETAGRWQDQTKTWDQIGAL